MKNWKIIVESLYIDTQLGVCVGEYIGFDPVIRHAVRGRLDAETPEHQVLASCLRQLADWLDEAYELRKQ